MTQYHRRRICIFGDSIPMGVIDDEKSGWADRLKAEKFGNDRLADTYNLGISADTSEDVLNRFESEAKSRRCDMLVFAVGVNDSQLLLDENANKVDIKQYEENLREIIKRSREIAESITFIGLTRADESKTTPVAWRETTHFTNEYIQKYDTLLKKVCEEEGLKYIPMFDLLDDDDLPDGIHPNATGHKKMFDRINKEI